MGNDSTKEGGKAFVSLGTHHGGSMLAFLGSAGPKADYFSMIGRRQSTELGKSKKAINMTPKPNRPYCRHKEFSKMPKNNTSYDAPCIRNSSKYDGSLDRTQVREAGHLGVKKDRWKSTKDFRTVNSQAALCTQEKAYIPNYVFRDPSNPPQIY